MNKKTEYVVADTNIWLLNPNWYEGFRDKIIVIPQVVIEELDGKKSSYGVLGLNARQSIKKISQIAEKYVEGFCKYISLDKDKFIIVETPSDLDVDLDLSINDNKIIVCALRLGLEEDNDVTLLSNDCNVRTKTFLYYGAFKVKAKELIEGEVRISDYYHIENIEATDKNLNDLYNYNLTVDDLNLSTNVANTPLYFRKEGETILATIKPSGLIYPLQINKKTNVYDISGGIKPVNEYQKQFVNLIKDESIKIVGCIGKTGSGKTLIALAAALKLIEDGAYSHIKLIKPYVPLGNTVGFLKGDLDSKLDPIKQSFNSALECMGVDIYSLEERGIVDFSSTEFERGKTYHSTLVIVDECQNLSNMEIKSLITRCGASSKIILLGDTKQIDSLYLSENYNGLSYVIDKLSGQDFFAPIFLNKSERADFINVVDELL